MSLPRGVGLNTRQASARKGTMGAMRTAQSSDGTVIAYDSWGEGPPVVLVGGAFNDRGTWAELGQALAGQGFTAVSYDRRGRGDSGDTEPYAVEREVEDLTAVIASVGERAGGEGPAAYLHGVSSGAALALRAVADGAPVLAVSGLEPPYRVEGGPPPEPDYLPTLVELRAQGRKADIVEYFLSGVGLSPEAIEGTRQSPMWAGMVALAPTLVYDTLCLGDVEHVVPVDLLSQVGVPALLISSTGSPDWLRRAAQECAAAVPYGEHRSFEGEFHQVATEVLAPALAEFYRSAGQPRQRAR
jgi:pimeloyl-ACP methyl ester carboxylesterase